MKLKLFKESFCKIKIFFEGKLLKIPPEIKSLLLKFNKFDVKKGKISGLLLKLK